MRERRRATRSGSAADRAPEASPLTGGDALLDTQAERLRALPLEPARRRAEAWACVLSVLPEVERHAGRRLWGWSAEERADAVQAALLRLFSAAEAGALAPPSGAPPGAWLGRAIDNALLDCARKRSAERRRIERLRARPAPAVGSGDGMPGPEAASVLRQELAAWRASITCATSRLVFLADRAPWMIERADVELARAQRMPAGSGLTRSAEETWALLERWRAEPARARGAERDGSLFFVFRGPPGLLDVRAWSAVEAKRAAGWFHWRLHRVRARLAAA
jgi:DNA-directed RNA polymerase specialized sigma24 family protein